MKRFFCTFCLLPALLITLPSTKAKAEEVVIEDIESPDAPINSVTLAWDPNPENDITGYILYYGRTAGTYNRLQTVTDTTATVGVRGNRTTYFAVTAFNADGVESDLSAEVQWP